jgi:F420-non-reducing hydrogenase iron-sulfur subunit
MTDIQKNCLALFYCQQVPGSSEKERLAIEKEYGKNLRLFPIPCSGRLEPIHLLRALEEIVDAAYVITCPEGACRYFEGNHRAKKRVERTRTIIKSIGLEPERVGIIVGSKNDPKSLAKLAEEIYDDISRLKPSPVQNRSKIQLRNP